MIGDPFPKWIWDTYFHWDSHIHRNSEPSSMMESPTMAIVDWHLVGWCHRRHRSVSMIHSYQVRDLVFLNFVSAVGQACHKWKTKNKNKNITIIFNNGKCASHPMWDWHTPHSGKQLRQYSMTNWCKLIRPASTIGWPIEINWLAMQSGIWTKMNDTRYQKGTIGEQNRNSTNWNGDLVCPH